MPPWMTPRSTCALSRWHAPATAPLSFPTPPHRSGRDLLARRAVVITRRREPRDTSIVAYLSTAGSQVVERGDSPMQIGSAQGGDGPGQLRTIPGSGSVPGVVSPLSVCWRHRDRVKHSDADRVSPCCPSRRRHLDWLRLLARRRHARAVALRSTAPAAVDVTDPQSDEGRICASAVARRVTFC